MYQKQETTQGIGEDAWCKVYLPVYKAITETINEFFISDFILAEGVDQDQQLTFTFSEAERSEKLDQIEVNIQELLCHLDISQMSRNQQKQMAFSQEL